MVDEEGVVVAFRLFKAKGGRDPDDILVSLKSAIATIPVSTAECERAFSLTNTILTPKRNRMTFSNLSSLMFISIIGPPITQFQPRQYAKNWLKRGHHGATDNISVKRVDKNEQSYYSHFHTLL